MSGENKLSFEERLKKYEAILDQYTVKIGIAHIMYNSEVNDLLMLNSDQLRGMSHEQCGESSYILSNYATFVQMEYNRQKARVDWANSELNKIIADQGDRYGDKYTKFDLLKARVISGDSSAQVLGNIIKHAEGRATQLESVAFGIRDMARYLESLQVTKRYKK